MEIFLADRCGFPKLLALRWQAAAPASKPLMLAPSTALGDILEVSAQAEGQPLLLVPSVSTSVVQRSCPDSAGSPMGNLASRGTCAQPSLTAKREVPICILSEVKGEFHQC